MPTIWEYIESFEKRFGNRATRIRARALMIDYLSQLNSPLPEVAAKGLAVAKRFHNGATSDEEREKTRRDCWEYVSSKENRSSVPTPEEAVVRAVIGTLDDLQLQSQPEGENLEWFFYFVERFEGYQRKKFEGESPTEEAFLKRYFSSLEM